MDAARIQALISPICPDTGVTIGVADDPETWQLHFGPEATAEQRAAAIAALDAFDPNAPTVPASVKMWQAKAALAAIGKLEPANAAIAAGGSDPLKLAWEYATDISRASASVAAIAGVLGMTSAQVDALFIGAAAIEV
jgi:hypothetical protein